MCKKRRTLMSLVKGIHHVALKCCTKQKYEEERKFYKDILGIPVIREWSDGMMLDTGSGILEIFNNGTDALDQGTIRHFAFATNDVDACVRAVFEAGYEVFVEPKDVVIPSTPEFPVRIAFCRGPLGEEIEFFMERSTL
jgi:glyoxylase I family protein